LKFILAPIPGTVLHFAPVLENTLGIADDLPDSEVFSRPDSMVLDGDGRSGNARRMAYTHVFNIPVHLVLIEAAHGGF
jgi:hypothetical protein